MNNHEVMLDMQFDQLWFKSGACDHYDFFDIEFVLSSQLDMRRFFMHQLSESSRSKSYDLPLSSVVALPPLRNQVMENQKSSKKMMILQRSFTIDKPTVCSNQKISSANSFPSAKFSVKLNVIMISIAAFNSLTKRNYKNKTYDFFSMFLHDINQVLNYIESRMSIRSMPEVKKSFTQKITLEKVNRLLSVKFKDLLQNFDLSLTEQLSPHRAYDHKIEFEENSRTIKSQMYSMFYHKLLKLKKYLDENLKKSFITASSILFASSVLFVVKFNDSLRFCVDYRKLNVMIKRNRYFISLIEETLIKVIDFKYLIKLNIIVAFNKLCMNLNSENFTTFITSLSLYKFKILPFGLTNGPANYQHYMNDVL